MSKALPKAYLHPIDVITRNIKKLDKYRFSKLRVKKKALGKKPSQGN